MERRHSCRPERVHGRNARPSWKWGLSMNEFGVPPLAVPARKTNARGNMFHVEHPVE
jgi:hypothetical protein